MKRSRDGWIDGMFKLCLAFIWGQTSTRNWRQRSENRNSHTMLLHAKMLQ